MTPTPRARAVSRLVSGDLREVIVHNPMMSIREMIDQIRCAQTGRVSEFVRPSRVQGALGWNGLWVVCILNHSQFPPSAAIPIHNPHSHIEGTAGGRNTEREGGS